MNQPLIRRPVVATVLGVMGIFAVSCAGPLPAPAPP
ncbi:MAG: hypothetical protein QOF38_3038, partial [Pseudonocardiales bacterium]|nr:hypothetical protein [Pseudonocardiales bacterium]